MPGGLLALPAWQRLQRAVELRPHPRATPARAGPLALWRGVAPSMLREATYSTVRWAACFQQGVSTTVLSACHTGGGRAAAGCRRAPSAPARTHGGRFTQRGWRQRHSGRHAGRGHCSPNLARPAACNSDCKHTPRRTVCVFTTPRYGAYDPIKAWLQQRFGASYTRAHAQQAAAAVSKGANETQAMPMHLKIAAGGMAGAAAGRGARREGAVCSIRAGAGWGGGWPPRAGPKGMLKPACTAHRARCLVHIPAARTRGADPSLHSTGALGAAGATPSDLIKVRAQAAAAGGAPAAGLFATGAAIYREEGGLRALYRGAGPTTLRAAMLTATQLPTYDHCKYGGRPRRAAEGWRCGAPPPRGRLGAAAPRSRGGRARKQPRGPWAAHESPSPMWQHAPDTHAPPPAPANMPPLMVYQS